MQSRHQRRDSGQRHLIMLMNEAIYRHCMNTLSTTRLGAQSQIVGVLLKPHEEEGSGETRFNTDRL